MAGATEIESAINRMVPPHRPRVRTMEYTAGGRTVKISDNRGELNPTEVDSEGKKIPRVQISEKQWVLKSDLDDKAKGLDNS